MTKPLILASVVLLLGAPAFAAPCATGTTTSTKGPTTKDTSSNAENNAAPKTTPGAKGESAGTVGAMNNAGGNSTPDKGQKPLPEGKPVQGQNSNDC